MSQLDDLRYPKLFLSIYGNGILLIILFLLMTGGSYLIAKMTFMLFYAGLLSPIILIKGVHGWWTKSDLSLLKKCEVIFVFFLPFLISGWIFLSMVQQESLGVLLGRNLP